LDVVGVKGWVREEISIMEGRRKSNSRVSKMFRDAEMERRIFEQEARKCKWKDDFERHGRAAEDYGIKTFRKTFIELEM
jgi:malate synthase